MKNSYPLGLGDVPSSYQVITILFDNLKAFL
jgi:hypothetical protein